MRIFQVVLLSFLLWSCSTEQKRGGQQSQRIITLGGAITETVFALNHGDQVIALDVTSTYPEDVKSKENLGHVKSINIEKIISLKPNLVLMNEGDLPEEKIKLITSAGIKVQAIQRDFTIEGTRQMVRVIGETLNEKERAQKIVDEIQLVEMSDPSQKKKVMFIYSRGPGNVLVAGKNTAMASVTELAKGENVLQDFEGYKPISTEFLLRANPDVIVLFDTGLQSLGGMDGLLAMEGMNQTTAGKNKSVIAMEGHFMSGFGPRIHLAADSLNELFYP